MEDFILACIGIGIYCIGFWIAYHKGRNDVIMETLNRIHDDAEKITNQRKYEVLMYFLNSIEKIK